MPACPWCAEEINPGLSVCPYCGSQLTPAGPSPAAQAAAPATAESGLAEWSRERLEKLRAWMKQPGRPRRSWPAKVRWPTYVWAGLAVACVVTGAIIANSMGPRDQGGCLAASIIFALLPAIVAIILFCVDLSQFGPDDRTSAMLGAKAWVKSIRWKRFDRAYACMVDQDHFDYGRPVIKDIGSQAGAFDFSDQRQFRDYWKGLVSQGDMQTRNVESWGVDRAEKIDEDTALVDVRLTVTSYPSLLMLLLLVNLLVCVIVILVMRKRHTFNMKKLVVRRGGQWWVVNGEADDNIDLALADAARAKL